MTVTPSLVRGILICLILAGVIAWIAQHPSVSPQVKAEPETAASVSKDPLPGVVVLNDPVKIFQKAFWRSPNANDQVLHAERREWKGDDGVGRWQWFIVVRPSPELLKYIRDDNAFGLALAKAATPVDGAPSWFTPESSELDVLRSLKTNLQFILSKSGDLLYATDSGSAFRPGAPEKPAPAAASVTSTSRLPNTPPPKPLSH